MKNKYSDLLKSKWFFIFILCLIVSTLYCQTLFHDLIFLDDDTLIFNKFTGMDLNEKISSSFNSNFLNGHYYRPITSLSFVVDSFFSVRSYFAYHFTNFLIHLVTSILIFLIIKNMGYSLLVSLVSALLFAINPININAVGWIAGRGDLLATLFSIFALLLYLKFIKYNKASLLIFVSVLLFLAILSKEVSLLVPFLFLILYFVEKKELLLNKSSISVLLMTIIVFTSYYLLRGIFLSRVHIDKFSFTAYYRNILVLPETISKFFIPTGIKALPSTELFTSISGIIIFVLILIIPFKFNSINKYRYYFGFLWFIFLLIPGMVFRTMEQDGFYYWDCRSYLPLIGIIFMIAEIVRVLDLQKCKKLCFLLIMIYLLILSAFTFVKIQMYQNPITYWNAVKTDYPSRYLPYIGLYNYYNHYKDLNNAEIQLLRAIEISPADFTIRKMLLDFYLTNNEKRKALLLAKDTLEKDVSDSDYFIEIFVSLSIELGQMDVINNLLIKKSDNEKIIELIRKLLKLKVESLKNDGNRLKSNLLFEKFLR